MSLLKQAASGFVWNHVGRVSEYVLVYIFSVIIARKLGAEVNGIYALLLSVVQILLIASSFGLETSVAAAIPQLLKQASKAEVASVLRGLLLIRIVAITAVGLVFLLVRDTIISTLGAPPLFVDVVSILVLYFALRSVVSLLTAVRIASLETKAVNIAGVAVRGMEVVGAMLLLGLGYGLKEIFVLIVLTGLVQVLVLLWLLREYMTWSNRISLPRALVSKTWKFWMNNLMEFLLGRQADVILLSYFLVTPMIIGYYDVALSFGYLINFGMTTGMYGVSAAAFASMALVDERAVSQYWNFLARMVILAVGPVLVFAIIFAEYLIPLIYSVEYRSSVVLFQIFGVFLIATRFVGGGIAADYFQASGRTNILLTAGAISGGVNILLAVLLIPRFQAIGAVFATGVGALSIAGIHAYSIARILPVRLPVTKGLFVVISCCIVAVVVRLLTDTLFDEHVFAPLFLYLALLLFVGYVTKPLSGEDAEFLRSISERLYSILRRFVSLDQTRVPGPDVARKLTDRQKWAYAWMSKTGVVVDVGSSSGPLCGVLAEKAVYAFAVDTDGSALRKLRDEQTPVQPIQASASQLPFPSGSVDTVLLLDVLEHVEDEKKTVDEVQRILRPGGKLILSVPNKGLFRFLDPLNIRSSSDGFHRHYSETDLTRLLFLRFRVLQQHYGGLFVYPLTFAAANFVQKRFGRDWNRFFKRLGDIDNDISWGRWSYNLIILAEKI